MFAIARGKDSPNLTPLVLPGPGYLVNKAGQGPPEHLPILLKGHSRTLKLAGSPPHADSHPDLGRSMPASMARTQPAQREIDQSAPR